MEEVKPKKQRDMENLNLQIQSIKDQLDSDTNLADDDRQSLSNFNNALQAKLYGMKDVQVSPKSDKTLLKEQRGRDNELSKKQQEAADMHRRLQAESLDIFRPDSPYKVDFQGNLTSLNRIANHQMNVPADNDRVIASNPEQGEGMGELARYNDLTNQYQPPESSYEVPTPEKKIPFSGEYGDYPEAEQVDAEPVTQAKVERYQDLLKAIKGQ